MKLVLKTIVVFSVPGIIMTFFKYPILTVKKKAAKFNMRTDNNGTSENYQKTMLQSDSLNIDMYYTYIKNHYSIPEYTWVGRSSHHRDDSEKMNRYDRLYSSGDNAALDIRNYCKG